ncbi:G-D-S-L family lipolytic protein [Flavobacteriaceae bacterium TP-CH-4]|uniref:G-D-S-L family lipolytic protein n=1 Tax=Pelagihabitans pacificus TaxID=2696054 RepID=A0A967ECJ0_9FLAO|nr:GDSL-type esterase/lipase family protein [Pelagihabitans pacificus]NHF61261.1 G-D-S-L family lipolytic protein [Pelagihabitans pacificus]
MKYLYLFPLFLMTLGQAQEASDFMEEVDAIQKKYDTLWDASKETIVFTGSSSVRIWNDLQERFPDYQIVNTGFGGSQATDLLAYSDALVLRFKPRKVFIYEGDNDLSAKKKPRAIVKTLANIIARIREQNAAAEIVLIAAKPSIVRWQMKRKYKKLNRKLKRWSQKDSLIDFADVWKPMLEGRKINEELFIEDGLHMNGKGYDIWYEVLKPYVK